MIEYLIGGAGLAAVGTYALAGLTTIKEWEKGIKMRFGKIVDNDIPKLSHLGFDFNQVNIVETC